ncbi:FAD-dependent urate hydroxylase [Lachnellula hyalina]|uniref:FAD-dependent urate hydroxylase n=1 Tax=Lachnellula hyalina TaxID=1316788 RepID=A0A8H8TXC2_9HELO|nr:FAD-dependent urate hydroxylase [Lachnellula hyalina]TVY25854.1 FAD-dependent urate hydroxylase [Lachnellula hyalina]
MAPLNIAIIGSGLSGLSLALALHQQNIPCTIYESRPASLNIGGAVMLSPNALKILDALGIYERVRDKGYNFETLEYKNGSGELLEVYEFGSKEKYGYEALRIYRTVLIDELLAMLKEKDISIVFGKKFTKVVAETENDVTWEFQDGSTQTADILVGADGIHSTVRCYLYPDLVPAFTGMAGVTAAVPTKQLKIPTGYHIPVTIMTPNGGFVIAPQEVDGSEVLIGKQKRMGEGFDRAGWDRYMADKDAFVEFLQEGASNFPEMVQNAVSHIPHNKINVWPFYAVPKLEKWASEKRRVIILGDAAHAIPPSAGQGINQAFEDVYMFALLLGQADKVEMQDTLSFWQDYRQKRITKVMWLNRQTDLRRMPKEAQTSGEIIEEIELSWLYLPNFKDDVESWVNGKLEKRD